MKRAEALQRKLDATAQRVTALTLPDGGASWATAAREDARARLAATGLPHGRDEYWRWTKPDTLTAVDAPKAAAFQSGDAPLFADIDCLKVVFVDGEFDAAQSDDLSGEALEIMRLSETLSTDIHWAKDLYGKLEIRAQDPVVRPLATLNTALCHRWRGDPRDGQGLAPREPDLHPSG